MPSTYTAATAVISDSFVAEGCEIAGRVEHSVISVGVSVGEGASVCDSVIMPNVTIENGAVIRHAIVGEGVTVGAGARIGERQLPKGDLQIAVVGKDQNIGPGQTVAPGEVV